MKRYHGILWHLECRKSKLAPILQPDHETISAARNDHDCPGSRSDGTALAMSSNRSSYNLPLWVAVGALAGILAGLFFGEYCRVLSPVGSAYVMLLQVVVYPYIICSLLHGLGRLSPPTALKLLKRGWFLLFLVWAVTFGTIFLLIQAIPSPEVAAVVDPAAVASSKSSLLALLIPANPFLALADNYVPAVVIMAILYGVAIQHYEKKASFLETLDVIRKASVRIWNWVVLLAPFAVFALFADTAGTVDLGQLKNLLIYVFLFTAGACILAFWVLPWLMSVLAPVTPKEVIREIQGGIVLAVATTLSVVALPAIMEATRKLAEQNGIVEDEERDEIINTTLAVSYPLGQLGNFFVFLFIPFAAYTFEMRLSGVQEVLLPFFTLLSSLGSPSSTVNAVSFLSNWLGLPPDASALYVETMTVTRYGQVVVSVVGIAFLTILTTFSYYGKHRLKAIRPVRGLLLPVLLILVLVFTMARLERKSETKDVPPFLSYSLSPSTTQGVDAVILREGDPAIREQETSLPHETALDRIRRTGVLRVGYFDAIIPFSYLNNKGELVGYDVAFAYEMAKALNVKPVFIPFGPRKGVAGLEAHRLDIIMCGAWVTKERLARLSMSKPYFHSSAALMVPSNKVAEFISRDKLLERKDLRVAVFDDPVLLSLLKNVLPNATPVIVKDYNHLHKFENFHAILWSLIQASAYAQAHKGTTAVRPKGMAGPLLFAYLLPPDSSDFARFIDFWLNLKENDGFMRAMQDYWLFGKPRQRDTPRWCILRDILHWKSDAK